MEEKNPNWGGKREGAGRPKESLSQNQVRQMLETAEILAEENGTTIDRILVGFIHDTEIGTRDRIACIKLFKDFTAPKIAEDGETDRALGPAVFLPEKHPRLTVVGE